MNWTIQKLIEITELRTRQLRKVISESEHRLTISQIQDTYWILEKHMRDLRVLQEDITSAFSLCEDINTYSPDIPPVKISEENGIYNLRFGAILPLKTKSRCDLLHNDLICEVMRYVAGRQIPLLEKGVVVFRHHYQDGNDPKRKLRDYDNLERKSVLDTLVPFFLPDDNPRCMRSFDMMTEDETSFTEILIMDWTHFQAYILADKTSFL